jgi:peptidyl-prolyl cis-trans isomerase D
VSVTPAEVEAFYKANQSKYSHAEQRDVKYLMADFNRLRSQIIPSEVELKKRYDASVNDFKTPEQARASHILIKVDPNSPPEVDAAAKAKADSLVKQLRGGADFATLAKANSADPQSAVKGGDLDWFSRGQMVPEFENAAFTQPIDQVGDPVKTSYGYHIIKVTGRRPAATKSFEEVKPQLAAQVAEQMAKDQARDEMTKIAARIRQAKPTTAEAFAAYATPSVSSNDTQWFQKSEPIPGIGANPALSGWAFTAKQNDIGEMIGTQRGIVIPFLYGIRPAGVAALAEIKDRVTQDAKMAKAKVLAVQALQAAIAGAPTVDAVAAKIGLPANDTTVNHQGFIGGISGDPTALVTAAFSSPAGKLVGPVAVGDGAVVFSVAEVKKVTDAEVKSNEASYVEMIRGQQTRSLRTVLLQKLRKDAKVDINDQALASRTKSQQQGA